MSEMDPPHDERAEQCTLGAAILAPAALTEVSSIVTAESFYRPAHGLLFTAMHALADSGQPVDPVTLAAHLERAGSLARVGGMSYLHTLIHETPTAANAAYYAEIVATKAKLRALIAAGSRIVQLGYGADDQDVADTVERARSMVDGLAVSRGSSDVLEIGDLLTSTLDELEATAAPHWPTGFRDLDDTLNGGLHAGTFTVIGARPGVGKSVLALRIAAHVASLGHGAIVFSLEMSRSELMARFFAAEGSIELTTLNSRALSQDDWRRAAEVANRAANWPLAVSDAPRIGITGMTARARDRKATPRGLAVVVVDYLQLVTPSDPRATREQQIAAISRGLKLMSRELEVAVVAAAQVNRGGEQHAGGRPRMSDLRESGAIEADADAVLLLHDDPDEEATGLLEVIVAKNRHGPRKTINLSWAPHYATARSLSRFSPEEVA